MSSKSAVYVLICCRTYFNCDFNTNKSAKIDPPIHQIDRLMNTFRFYPKSFLALFLVIPMLLSANHPMVRNFPKTVYKAGAQNWGIAQHESNAMYFANNSGLLEFDGKNWTTYPIINGTHVRSILYADDGRIYASTFNEFGYYEKQETGRFEYYSLLDSLGISPVGSNEIYYIHKGNDNSIYFQAEKRVYHYKDDRIVQYPYDAIIDASAFIHNALFVASVQNGVSMLSGKMFVRLPGSELLVNKKVSAIIAFQSDKVMFVTSFHGAFVFDGKSITPYDTGIDDFLMNNQVFCAASNQNQIVFGTVQRGIAVLDVRDNSVLYSNTYSGLQNNTVLSVAFDNQSNLWLGLDRGIDYVMLNTPVRNIFGTNNLYGAGYTSLLKDRVMYFGTNQGLYSTSYPIRESPYPQQYNLVKGIEGQVWNLTEIDNTLFCGSDQGAFIIHPNRIEKLKGLSGTWNFIALKYRPDLILGCSYQGLFLLKKTQNQWRFHQFLKGGFAESSVMFEEADDETIWFSHWQKGMFRLHLNKEKDSIESVDIYTENKGFPSSRNNTVFRVNKELIFSSENGFYQYDKKTDSMKPYEKWNKLFETTSPSYMRLHEGLNGDVWCVSGRFVGLARKTQGDNYVLDSLTYRILQTKIIIGFEHFNFLDSTRLILTTEDGFYNIDTSKEVKSKSDFKVFLRSVLISNEKRNVLAGIDSEGKTQSTFDHRSNSLRFDFIAPEFRNEGLVQYSYMLENYDESWSEYSVDNIKEYTQLPKGKYVFKVRAKDQLESKEASYSYAFTILPAWYESRTAMVIYFILLMLAVAALVVFINHRSRKGAVEMERLKEIEIKEQKVRFEAETSEKKREIKELKNQQLQYELRHKSQELASSTMNLIRKNEMLLEMMENLSKLSNEIRTNHGSNDALNRLSRMERTIRQNIEQDDNWKKFEENFDLVYENYLKRLGEMYPDLNISDKKLCAYLKMDLSSKDIAPLMNMSVRSVETNRYRLRKKMGLERDVNLADYLQKL